MQRKSMLSGYDIKSDVFFAVEELSKNLDYAQIGIVDICTAANISRQTFYRYFSSKFDIAVWTQRVLFEDQYLPLLDALGHEKTMCVMLSQIRPYSTFLCSLANSKDKNKLIEACSHIYMENFTNNIKQNGSVITDEISFQMDCFAHSSAYSVVKWYASGTAMDPELLAGFIYRLAPDALSQVMI